ncbi:MAG TPA: hypothetical protein VGP99_13510 [Tepidisphaeraceae bacterium]|jgi:hypothetical protein|nr:hypothetical protein [Tepidisphaeraceae bacterium]
MSRAATGDTVVLKPVNNIYTVLSGVALVVVILGLVAIWLRSQTLWSDVGGLFGPPPAQQSTGRR